MNESAPKSLTSRIVSFPFFLLLIGVYPVLYLMAENIEQAAPASAFRAILTALSVSFLIFVTCRIIFPEGNQCALFTMLFNLAFFSYGHLFNLIDGKKLGTILIGRQFFFFPVFVVICISLFLLLRQRSRSYKLPVYTLNALLAGLCLVQVVQIGLYETSSRTKIKMQTEDPPALTTGVHDSPDIYYIILDGLAREDVLRDELKDKRYDLPEELAKRGFVIPKCAFSNYGTTALSMSSSLNFDYLDELGIPDQIITSSRNDPPEVYRLLHQNRVVRYLKQRGYEFVSFRGFFPINDFKEADYYFNFEKNQLGRDRLAENKFQEMFIHTTMLRLLSDFIEGYPEAGNLVPEPVAEWIAPEASVFSSRSYQWYQQHLYAFDQLETVPSLPGAKFVYAHFYSTHQPYVFRPDGSLLWPINEDNDGYVDAVNFTASRILQVIDRILRDSPEPPVVIIQADHGYGEEMNKYKILNAYYLPNGGDQDIYPTITPVNTFRVVLDRYAGGRFGFLPDIIMQPQPGKSDFNPIPVRCDPESVWP